MCVCFSYIPCTKHGLALRHKIRRCTVEVDHGCSITDKGAFQGSGGLLLLTFYIYIPPSLFFRILLDGNKGKTLNRGQDRCSESKMCAMNKHRNYSDGYRRLKLQCRHCRHLHIIFSSCPHPVCALPPYFALILESAIPAFRMKDAKTVVCAVTFSRKCKMVEVLTDCGVKKMKH